MSVKSQIQMAEENRMTFDEILALEKIELVQNFNLWYDNGTGYYEGPYHTEAESFAEAVKKENLTWCLNMYGIGAVVNTELNPNIPENWKSIKIEE